MQLTPSQHASEMKADSNRYTTLRWVFPGTYNSTYLKISKMKQIMRHNGQEIRISFRPAKSTPESRKTIFNSLPKLFTGKETPQHKIRNRERKQLY